MPKKMKKFRVTIVMDGKTFADEIWAYDKKSIRGLLKNPLYKLIPVKIKSIREIKNG